MNNTLILIPGHSLGGFTFCTARTDVRNSFSTFKSFRKSPSSQRDTDIYGDCHAYYDEQDRLAAIEVFEGTAVVFQGKTIVPNTVSDIRKTFPDFQGKNGDYYSPMLSARFYAPEDTIESAIFGTKAYMDSY